MSIIEKKEGKETANITRQFLVEYALYIGKASKEDWLAFIGLKDSISNTEEQFVEKLESLFERKAHLQSSHHPFSQTFLGPFP